MKFKVSEDIDAPISMTWDGLTDFSGFEADVRGRGVDLHRVANWETTAEGVEWRGTATVRGKQRPITAKVTRLIPNDVCLVDSRIGGMACAYEMNFVELAPEVTRVAIILDLTADTLAARLILQTMKLARGRVLQRLQAMLARQGNAVESAWRRQKNT